MTGRGLRYAIHLVWSVSRREVILLLVLCTLGQLALPIAVVLSERVVNLVASAGREHATVGDWLPWALGLAVAFTAQRLFPMIQQNHQRRLGEELSQRCETIFLEAAARADLGLIEDPQWRAMMQRAARSSGRQADLVFGMLQLYGTLVMSVTLLGVLVTLSPVLVLLAILLIAAGIPQRRMQANAVYNAFDEFTSNEQERMYIRFLLTETYPAKDVEAYGLSGHLLRRHLVLSQQWVRRFSRAMRRMDLYALGIGAVTALVALGAYTFVIYEGVQGRISPGGVTATIGAFTGLTSAFAMITQSNASIAESGRFLGDLFSFLATQPLVTAKDNAVTLSERRGEAISFEGVHFHYPGSTRPALDGLDLAIRGGELMAIVGSNGSGKSTLVKLLLRFYDPDEGTIRLGGVSIRDTDPHELRQHIGVLFQDFVVFDFTARENITFGRVDEQDRDDDLEKALKAAHASGIVDTLAAGLDTNLGHLAEDSRPLSGGEMQRIGLARLIFRNADIWILDEPTSALDAEAEEAVFSEVRYLLTGRTGIIISHRFSTVRLADRIAVMDAGRVIELGTHVELMARQGRYAELFEFQASRYR